MTAKPGLAHDALQLHPYGNSERQKVIQKVARLVTLSLSGLFFTRLKITCVAGKEGKEAAMQCNNSRHSEKPRSVFVFV